MPGGRGGPDRFLTTVLMTDIVGSTEHASELGDRAWRDLIAQHHALVRAALQRHGGKEIDTAGDGFFATFDAPASAVACALEIADEVKQLGVEIRAGIHVGEVEQAGRKVGGISVPIASRIMSAAEPSEVLASSTVRDLVTGSGLAFEDRGVRELKGVPGEWHIYAVSRPNADADASLDATAARERRASAVRRSAARPIWQRRPRLVAFTAVALAIVLATGGLLIWRPWAQTGVSEDSVGIINSASSELVGQIRVGTRPGEIAVGEGFAWVTNTGGDTVSQVDVYARDVVTRISVGKAPKGIVVADGLVWVANSGQRTVSRINVDTGTVVGNPIDVGNGPTAIAAAGSLLWVANAIDSTVVSIESATGAVGEPIGVPPGPIALVADQQGLWVASEDGASVSHLDPITGVARAAPIQLVGRPSALTLDSDAVWVGSADGRVMRIDRATNGVTDTIMVGGSLAAIVASGDSIWVGDQDGNVSRLDRANPSPPASHISAGSAVAALAAIDGDIWMAAQPSAASHRGGTLRIVEFAPDGLPRFVMDPLGSPNANVASLEGDGLVAYRRMGGTAGSALLADLATSVPRPTNDGLTYEFQLRPNLTYSTGAPVRASDFRRAIERSFQVEAGFDIWGPFLFPMIQGADVCIPHETKQGPRYLVERCDLSAGIVTDDVANTVIFNLATQDADFVYRLANIVSYPVPEGVSMNEPSTGGPFPARVHTSSARRRTTRFIWDAIRGSRCGTLQCVLTGFQTRSSSPS